jgi:hypothetical protein
MAAAGRSGFGGGRFAAGCDFDDFLRGGAQGKTGADPAAEAEKREDDRQQLAHERPQNGRMMSATCWP